MSGIILTKDSMPTEIEAYFRGILALDEQEKVFSVNLDDVWQLCYPRKDHAVRELKNNFIENVDYISIAQNGNVVQTHENQALPKNGEQNGRGGNNRIDYYLTSACLEYFVARKVRPVFEVYRRVFHHVAHSIEKQPTQIEVFQKKMMFADWSAKFLNLNDASKLGIAQRIGKEVGLDEALPKAINAGTDHPTLHSAKDLLKEHGIEISVQVFNKVLEAKGIVRTATRPGKAGKTHSWKVLQPAYDKYGQNVQDPKFQSQTQIKWYDSLFGELLALAGVAKEESFNI